RIVLQTLTGPYGRFNVRQPELLPLCHQLLRHACPSSTMTRSLHIPPTARKNAVYGALTIILSSRQLTPAKNNSACLRSSLAHQRAWQIPSSGPTVAGHSKSSTYVV